MNDRISLKALGSCLTLTLGAGLAAAASPPANTPATAPAADLTELSLEQLMAIPVYAAARREQRSSEAASSVTIVTGQEIANHGWRTLADVINAVPGFYMTYDRAYRCIGVRGFGRPGDYDTRILILLNGARINEPIFDHGGAGHDAFVDVAIIDRVEVVRGPSSSLYGTNAFLAVVNIITRDGAGAAGGRVAATYATAETRRGLVTYGTRRPSGLDAFVAAAGGRSDGRDFTFPEFGAPTTNFGRAEAVDGEDYGNVFAKLTWGGLTYQGAYAHRRKINPTAYYGTRFNDPRTRDVDKRFLNSLTFAPGLSSLIDVQATLTQLYYAYDGDYAYDVSPAQDGSQTTINEDRLRAGCWGIDVKAATVALPAQRITAGVEYRDNYRLDQVNEDAGAEVPIYEDRRQSSVVGVYGENEIELGTRAHVTLGLRYDRIGLSGEERLSPRAGLILSPWSGGTLKLLGGGAFRSPSPFEMYYNDGGQTSKPNPGLESESIRTYETVLEQRWGERLFGSAAVYHYAIDDLISQSMDPEDDLVQFANIDQAVADGGELGLRCQFGGGITGSVSYSYADARDARTREWLTNSPRHLGKVQLSGPLGWAGLRAGLEVLHESERRTYTGDRTAAATIANLRLARHDLAGRWDLAIAFYNALDAAYGYPVGEEHVQDQVPADGRIVQVTAELDF